MTKMTIYTKGTFKIVENPAIVEKFLLTEQSAIVRFYCTVLLRRPSKAGASSSSIVLGMITWRH